MFFVNEEGSGKQATYFNYHDAKITFIAFKQ